MGDATIPTLVKTALEEISGELYRIENVDVVEGDVLATINGVNYAIVVEAI